MIRPKLTSIANIWVLKIPSGKISTNTKTNGIRINKITENFKLRENFPMALKHVCVALRFICD